MKKILMIVFGLLLLGCGDIGHLNEINKRVGNEYSKLDGLFAEEKTVRIIEFFDFGCSHCRDAATVIQNLKKEFKNDIDVQYKHFSIFPKSKVVAQASECARNQGKFQEFHDTYFAKYFGLTDSDTLQELTLELGMDLDEFFQLQSKRLNRYKSVPSR